MATNDRIDELLRLVESEADGMREAEFLQLETMLKGLVGKTITRAAVEETRIVIETDDGKHHAFYGYLGGRSDDA
ncbi:MAG TPA: hypothetical protein VGF86_15755 [Candidatus Tumulicola sp.]|jgi:hypothetical protein